MKVCWFREVFWKTKTRQRGKKGESCTWPSWIYFCFYSSTVQSSKEGRRGDQHYEQRWFAADITMTRISWKQRGNFTPTPNPWHLDATKPEFLSETRQLSKKYGTPTIPYTSASTTSNTLSLLSNNLPGIQLAISFPQPRAIVSEGNHMVQHSSGMDMDMLWSSVLCRCWTDPSEDYWSRW